MGIDEYTYLGELPDEYGDETTDDVNDRIIHMHNQRQLLDSIKKKVSKYELKFLLKELGDENEEFWHLVLITLIKTYSLNNLKSYLADGFDNMDLKKEVRNLFIFIKFKMIRLIENKKIFKEMNRDELESSFDNIVIPKLMKDVLLFLDNDSLDLFLNNIVEEEKSDYIDN